MSPKTAFLATEILLSLAIFLQQLENISLQNLPRLQRGILSREVYRGILFLGLIAAAILPPMLFWGVDLAGLQALLTGLMFISILVVAVSFGGSFNGGSDHMSIQIALALMGSNLAAWLAPALTNEAQKIALLYIAVQLGLSYFVAGVVKIKNQDWLTGRAIHELVAAENYEIPDVLRKVSQSAPKRATVAAALSVLGFELLFPLSFLSLTAMSFTLVLAVGFHLVNYAVLGLNRFVFAWAAAYPAALFLSSMLTQP